MSLGDLLYPLAHTQANTAEHCTCHDRAYDLRREHTAHAVILKYGSDRATQCDDG